MRPDYIFCKDHTHTETRESMEALLRPLGAPIVSRQHWADYRAPQWPIQGNSGQMALGLGVLLGCAPVIAVGFDCYQNGTYFHDPDAKNVSKGRLESHWQLKYKRLAEKLAGSSVRFVDRAFIRAFPKYDPAETFPVAHIPPALQQYRDMKVYTARALRDFGLRFDARATVPAGKVFAISAFEAGHHLREGEIEIVDSDPGTVISSSP
jgi:hypothetical protein